MSNMAKLSNSDVDIEANISKSTSKSKTRNRHHHFVTNEEIEIEIVNAVETPTNQDVISNAPPVPKRRKVSPLSEDTNANCRPRVKKKRAPDPSDSINKDDSAEVDNEQPKRKRNVSRKTIINEERDIRRKLRAQPRRTPTDKVRDQRKFYQKFPDLIARVVKPSDWSQILVLNLATLTALTGSILFSIRPPTSPTNPPSVNTTDDPFPYLHILPLSQRNITNQETSVTIQVIDPNYGSMVPTTLAVLTSPWTYNLLNTFGRKKSLMLAALPQILAGCLVGVDDIYVFYFTRFLSGLSDSITNVALPTFIGEVATPHVRGTWGNSMAVNTYLGNMILNGIESFLKVSITSYVLVFLPIFLLIIFACFPEPPHYYLLKDKHNRAWESLKFLRRSKNIDKEFQRIKNDVDEQKNKEITFSKLFDNVRHRKSLLVAMMIRCCEQFCGVGALRLYTQQMFQETIENISFNDATLIYSVLMAVATTISSIFLSKIGRRRAMCVSSYGCAVFLFLIALYYYLHYETVQDVSNFNWIPMFSLIGFIPMYALGLGIVPTLILGEIFAIGIKARALCVMHIVFTFLVAAIDIMFYYLFTNFGLCTPFFFYSASCVASFVLNYFFLPDMDDLTLEEIQETIMKDSVKKTIFERFKAAIRMKQQN